MAFGYDINGKKEEAVKPVTDSTGFTKYEKETVEEVMEYPIVAIPERGLRKFACKRFGIRCKLNDRDEIEAIYYPFHKERGSVGSGDFYISGYKKKDLTVPKKAPKGKRSYHFTAVGELDYDCLLFGIAQAKKLSGLRFVITEGENDAAAYFQSCAVFHGKRNEKQKISDLVMLSIGFGTSTAVKHISNERNQYYLNKFEKKVLCFDNDEVTAEEHKSGMRKGKEATKAVVSMYPEYMIANTRYDLNDPNDMLQAGRGDELFWAMMKPDSYSSDSFVDLSRYKDQLILLPKIGRLWGWESMDRLTMGKRKGDGYFFGAGVGQGKSLLVGKVLEDQMKVDGHPPTAFMFEESPDVAVTKIMGLSSGRRFHDPSKVIYDNPDGTIVDCWGDPIKKGSLGYFREADLIKANKEFDEDAILIYNNEGYPSWEKIKADIRYAVGVRGSKDIIIDPFTCLYEFLPPSEANTLLGEICTDLKFMGPELGFNYYIYCHLNAPTFGPPHEEGGKVKGNQFTGSKAMMRAAVGQWGLERNRSDHLPSIITNMSWMNYLKDRIYGKTGGFHLYYDPDTGSFEEPTKEILEEYEEALAYEKEGQYNGSKSSKKSVNAGPTAFTNEDWVKEENK